jgi:hypothetical protein
MEVACPEPFWLLEQGELGFGFRLCDWKDWFPIVLDGNKGAGCLG